MKPGLPVVSATNVTAASGTLYPAPRNAAAPTTAKSVSSARPMSPPASRPVSAPAATSGIKTPPTPPPLSVTALAAIRSTSIPATAPSACVGSAAHLIARVPVPRITPSFAIVEASRTIPKSSKPAMGRRNESGYFFTIRFARRIKIANTCATAPAAIPRARARSKSLQSIFTFPCTGKRRDGPSIPTLTR